MHSFGTFLINGYNTIPYSDKKMLMNVKLGLTLVMRTLIVPILREASLVIVEVLTLVMDSLVYVSMLTLCYCKMN